MRRGLSFTGITALVALAVALLGEGLVAAPGRGGRRAGAAVGFVCQAFAYWVLFVWALPGQRVLAHGLAVLGRFFVVAATALVGVPLAGLPPAPTLFALVAVLFATTLLEPLFVQDGFSQASPGGAAPPPTRR